MIRIKVKPILSIVIFFVLLFLAIVYAFGKDLEQTNRRGDSAIFEQLIENIYSGKNAYSNVFANTQNYIDNYAGKTPEKLIIEGTLEGPSEQERNMLKFHAYYILFPLAFLVNFFTASLSLGIVQSLCYFGLLVATYLFLYKKTDNVLASLLFIIIVALNPNWYGGLQGWFYPDKIFILACFFLCWVIYEHKKIFLLALAVGILILTNERAALVGGMIIIFLIFPLSSTQVQLWLAKDKRLIFLILTAVILFVYAYMQKNYILENSYYSGHYLPSSYAELMARLNNVQFIKNLGLNLLNNAPLLLFSLFAPRYALVSIAILSLNLFGNIGGAEKIGWTTHYHSYYFPLLVFSAMVGFSKVVLKIESLDIKQKIITYIVLGGFVGLLYVTQEHYKINAVGIRPVGTFKHAFSQIHNKFEGKVTGYNLRQEIRNYIVQNSTVATTELGIALIYNYTKVSFFPIDISKANYVFLYSADLDLVFSYQGESIALSRWLELQGFDLSRSIYFSALGYSLIPRKNIKFLAEE